MGFRSPFDKILLFILALLLQSMMAYADLYAATLRITWVDTAGDEDGFKIERLVGGLVEATMTSGPNATSYTDSGLVSGTIYCYRVLAYNSAGNSSASNQPCATAMDSATAGQTLLKATAGVNARTLTFSWSGISAPTATDWVGIYSPSSPDSNFLYWMYLSCTQTPSIPQSSGSCSYVLPQTLPAGNYDLRFFANDGFARLGTPISFTVSTVNVPVATLTASPTRVSIGGTLTVSWSGISNPTPTDWIGLHAIGAADTNFFGWIYVSCSSTASTARAAGSCPFVMPTTTNAGNYEFRLFANDTYTRIGATTVAIAGTPATPGNLVVRFQ